MLAAISELAELHQEVVAATEVSVLCPPCPLCLMRLMRLLRLLGTALRSS